MTPEPLNGILVASLLAVLALFALAGAVLLVAIVWFLITAGRYRGLRAREDLDTLHVARADAWLRRGSWGLVGCVALIVCYQVRGWVGDMYYDEIARGLIPYSRAWWVVWSASLPYYASLPAGAIGTVAVLLASRNLTRVMRSAPRPDGA